MSNNRPVVRIVCKSKQTGNFAELVAFWPNDRGFLSGMFSREIESIKMKDGRVIRPEQVFVNFYDDREKQANGKSNGSAYSEPEYSNEDQEEEIPF